MKPPSQVNESRKHFVTREDITKVIDACPDAEWRLIVALSRYGGLRCPSEHLNLQINDVDWDRQRVRVRSPKKEHLEGGGERWFPLFPELRPYLEEVFDLAEPGQSYFITRYRDTNANLRTQFLRIIRRAGVSSWPKLFHNLRASRETELAAEFPIHVVCSWIGNTERIAAKHYLQVTDDYFERAAKSSASALQNPVQQGAALSCNEGPEMTQGSTEPSLTRNDATLCESVRCTGIPPRGLEPLS